MRKIKEIIIHCSATPEGRDYSAADINGWHLRRGFNRIGYHYVIRIDGSIEGGRPLYMPGAHCRGRNSNSIGICYIGGLTADGRKPKDTRTLRQRGALRSLVNRLCEQFPGIIVYGHNDFAAKDCPCFNVGEEFRQP